MKRQKKEEPDLLSVCQKEVYLLHKQSCGIRLAMNCSLYYLFRNVKFMTLKKLKNKEKKTGKSITIHLVSITTRMFISQWRLENSD